MKKENKTRIEASLDAERKWGEDVRKFANATLLTKANSVSFRPFSVSGDTFLIKYSGIWAITFPESRESR